MHTLYPWHTTQWQALIQRWQNKTLPHALLLSGPKEVGKLQFAHAFMTRLFCKTPVTEQFAPACGHCPSCQWLEEDNHPDLHILHPEKEGGGIKIDQIRALLTALQQTTQQSGQKVIILEPAEAMNNAASNALLKALEEPHGSAVFLLVSHSPGALSATIRSRCQKIDFPVPPLSTSLAWLKTQCSDAGHAETLLALSENIPLRALAFSQGTRLEAHQQLVTQCIQLYQGTLSPIALGKTATEMPAEHAHTALSLLLLDIIRLQHDKTTSIAHTTQYDAVLEIATRISPQKIFCLADQLSVLKKHIDSAIHLNMPLLWESFFIDWVETCR
jgi:DNA polymerase-3 subunit delta'